MNEDQGTVRRCIEDGDFDIEWTRGIPQVQFWPDAPFDNILKSVSLREVLLYDLCTNVPLEFYGDPLAFNPPKGWIHAEKVQLLQALIRTYDKWARRTAH